MDPAVNVQTQVLTGLPRIGDPAPQFTADTTFGTLKLEDFRGSWLILFSHPADFTREVCREQPDARVGEPPSTPGGPRVQLPQGVAHGARGTD